MREQASNQELKAIHNTLQRLIQLTTLGIYLTRCETKPL